MTESKQRHGCLTTFLVVGIILHSLTALVNLLGGAMMRQSFPDAPIWGFPLLGILGVFNIVCMIALFQWKKWGFYGAAASGLPVVLPNLPYLSESPAPVVEFAPLLYVAVLFGVLQIGGDKKGWTQLE